MVCKSPDSDLLKSHTCKSSDQGERYRAFLHSVEDTSCLPLFQRYAVSHPSLFMALKRSVMEHVKKGVFIGQALESGKKQPINCMKETLAS